MASVSESSSQAWRKISGAIACALLILSTSAPTYAELPAVRVSEIATPTGTKISGAKWVAIEGEGNRRFVTAIFKPDGPGPFPVIVALHGASGLQDRYLEVAAELAHHGFLVVAGCWQAAKSPMPICANATPQDEWVADPTRNSGKELIAAAIALPEARAGRTALYGMSRGGHAALWAAASGAPVQAVVVDAAAHKPAMAVPPPSTLGIVSKISVPVLLLHGTNDYVIPVDQSREYERAARALGKVVTAVYFDGGGHMVTIESATRPEAIRQAVAFLREHLR